ncbi:MAG: PaREP1 family protein [Pyrobaculum sp.]
MDVRALVEGARGVFEYAVEELERALATRDVFLYRNAADKAFLALVLLINAFIAAKTGVLPRSHAERRKMLREMGREDLRALYSDLMKTLHDEAYYEGVYQPEEVKYAFEKIKALFEEVAKSLQAQ